jgi:hypothetical protein
MGKLKKAKTSRKRCYYFFDWFDTHLKSNWFRSTGSTKNEDIELKKTLFNENKSNGINGHTVDLDEIESKEKKSS